MVKSICVLKSVLVYYNKHSLFYKKIIILERVALLIKFLFSCFILISILSVFKAKTFEGHAVDLMGKIYSCPYEAFEVIKAKTGKAKPASVR